MVIYMDFIFPSLFFLLFPEIYLFNYLMDTCLLSLTLKEAKFLKTTELFIQKNQNRLANF